MTLVVTGTLADWDRDSVKSVVASHGGRAASSVSSRTTAVVTGAKPGASKLTKAETLGVPVWDEAEFLAVLGGGGLPQS